MGGKLYRAIAMAMIDPAGTYKQIPVDNCYYWLSYYHQKRKMVAKFDEEGKKTMVKESEMCLVFEQHRSKETFFLGEKESLLGHARIVTSDIDLISMVLDSDTPGNKLYELAMAHPEFTGCVASI